MVVLDTDHINALQYRSSAAGDLLAERLLTAGQEVATTIVSFEEHMRGWLSAIHRATDPYQQIKPYRRLHHLLAFYASWDVLLLDDAAAEEFHRLRQSGVRIGSMDLKIACIAKTSEALLLSRNLRDFGKVPGLKVEDWLTQATT